ncbi:hypothetical protein PVAP13_3NG167505 [Panicum virgatum]|uniref:Uncharacterized protein n=1 Tax=Panicum virgatum TaxID=38727 RepID=A0A8T0UC04_PANVG|nr:hypothetical protein PVAP13_3NG167505 [Panicum virgatum]
MDNCPHLVPLPSLVLTSGGAHHKSSRPCTLVS